MRLPLLASLLFTGISSGVAAPSLPAIRESLIQWEGYRLTPYRDPSGRATCVGVGHNLTAHRERAKPRYSAYEVEQLLLRDISTALDACRAAIEGYDTLPDDIQLVCLHLAFTSGRAGLFRFTNLRRALKYRAYALAASELRHSRWYTQASPTRARWAYGVLASYP